MTSDEFIKEVHDSNIMPEDFDEMYLQFQNYQKLALGALLEFHSVCVHNGIDYQLAFGSLLGAIRDDGQIPWDYDIDVFVPFIQREKLVDALRADLKEQYYFDCVEKRPECRNEMIRVSPKGYRSEVIHVDVFFLCPEPDDDKVFEKHTKKIRKICNARFYKAVNVKDIYRGNKRRAVYYFVRKIPYLLWPFNDMHNKYIELCSMFDYNTANRFVNANGFAGTYFMPAENMRNTMDYETSVGTFRIPVNYEEVLTALFKDYRRIFPLQDRLNEITKNLKFIETYNELYPNE